MKVVRGVRWMVVAALCAPHAAAVAQQTVVSLESFMELFDQSKIVQSMKPADIPDGFRAVKIKVPGDAGIGDMFGGMFGLMGFAMRSGGGGEGGEQEQQMQLLSVLDASWTKGDAVTLGGETYLVTYRMDLGLAEMAAEKMPEIELRLHLVNWKSISMISPMPHVTKQRLIDLSKSGGASPAEAPGDGKAATISNAKQIGLAMLMYSADWDDVLPYPQSTKAVQFVTQPYVKNLDIWKTHNPNAGQFQFNMALGGVLTTSVENPNEVPVFYESITWPDGTRVVVYLDGHVRAIDRAEWDGLQQYLRPRWPREAKKPLPANWGQDGWR